MKPRVDLWPPRAVQAHTYTHELVHSHKHTHTHTLVHTHKPNNKNKNTQSSGERAKSTKSLTEEARNPLVI